MASTGFEETRNASGAALVTKQDLLATEHRLTIRLGGMLVVLAGVLSAVFHYLR